MIVPATTPPAIIERLHVFRRAIVLLDPDPTPFDTQQAAEPVDGHFVRRTGGRLTPTYCIKKGTRYRYHVRLLWSPAPRAAAPSITYKLAWAAVGFEPVFATEFPENRDKYREIYQNRRRGGPPAADQPMPWGLSTPLPDKSDREFLARNREMVFRKQGICADQSDGLTPPKFVLVVVSVTKQSTR
jgi:hypothetical protein